MIEQTKYVLGFMISNDNRIALIQKKRPSWQAGLLNGIGGHIEPDDSCAKQAMRREFEEETNVYHYDWEKFAVIKSPHSHVTCYRSFVNELPRMASNTDETVFIMNIFAIDYSKCVPHLRWLIPLALDTNSNKAYIHYHKY